MYQMRYTFNFNYHQFAFKKSNYAMKKIHVIVALFQRLNIVLFWWLLSTVMNVCSLTFDYMQID